MGVPSHQFWRGTCRAFQLSSRPHCRVQILRIPCNPQVAPSCFRAALCGQVGWGWRHHEVKTLQVYNVLRTPPDIMRTLAARLRPEAPWLALTRGKSLPPSDRKQKSTSSE